LVINAGWQLIFWLVGEKFNEVFEGGFEGWGCAEVALNIFRSGQASKVLKS
jgi:hypothetical protein